MFKNGKAGLEIWWIATFPQNLVLAWWCLRKCVLWTTDAETERLRHGIKKSPPQTHTQFLQKLKKHPSVWPKESNNQNLKPIRTLGSEIIATQIDRLTTDKFRFHELCWQSQAELKYSGDMADSYLSTKLELIHFIVFEKTRFTNAGLNDRRMPSPWQ